MIVREERGFFIVRDGTDEYLARGPNIWRMVGDRAHLLSGKVHPELVFKIRAAIDAR